MPWARPETWDRETLAHYATLARLRMEHVAMRRGGLRWAHVSDNALVFVREHAEGSVLVCARRTGGPEIRLPATALGAIEGAALLGPELARAGDDVVLPGAGGPAFALYALSL
jgi:alpha-glucosidase